MKTSTASSPSSNTPSRKGGAVVGMAAWAAILTALIPALAAPNDPLAPAVHRDMRSGRVLWVVAKPGHEMHIPLRAGQTEPMAVDFFSTEPGKLFGVTDPASQLVLDRQRTDALGYTHTTFNQVHRGVPVFSGVLKVHRNAAGGVTAANGDFYPIPEKLRTEPSITALEAEEAARHRANAPNAVASSELMIVDPGWYGDPPRGAQLAWYIVLNDPSIPLREAFFVHAHTREILDQWTLLETILHREVYDYMGAGGPGVLARSEGEPPTGIADVDFAYDYSGDTYGYFFRAFDRDSTDNAGLIMRSNVHLGSSLCPNAFGGGGVSTFCAGTASDDVTAHEFMHSITGFTARLIYQNQSGQLNEAMSDIFGELIDLYNGNASLAGAPGGTAWPAHGSGPGTDTPNNLRTQCSIPPAAYLTVNSPGTIAGNYVAANASFGPALTMSGTTADVVFINPSTACIADGAFTNPPFAFPGRIALVDRGNCTFVEKVLRVQNAGCVGAIVVNNIPGAPPFTMGGSDPGITIPSIMVSYEVGQLLRSVVGAVNTTLRDAPDGLIDGTRWLVGEDATAFGLPIRDMWDPTCKGHPDRANSPLQTCGGPSMSDNGGVHSGSGVVNHAFAIMTDGKTFNGYTVNGIGPIKAGAVVYRALTEYMTAATDFDEAYYAFNAAAADLVGTTPNDPRTGSPSSSMFTSADAQEVDKALLATEMHTEGACGASVNILNPEPPTLCEPHSFLYADGFEGGINGWTVSNTNPPTPYDWVQTGDLPFGRPGTAWYCLDPNYGDCQENDESGVHYLVSPVIQLPANLSETYVKFTHYMASEPGWDGGLVSFDDGGGTFVPFTSAYLTYNPYNAVINSAGSGNTNPLAGLEGFTGAGGRWGTTLIRLTEFESIPTPQTIRLRFEFGKDGCTGIDGWYIDDFQVIHCAACISDVNCDDNAVCTCDKCSSGSCSNTATSYGNTNCLGPAQANLDDILCTLSGFANYANCPNGDLQPNCVGNNTINLDDILAVLAAFGGADPCACGP